MNQGGMRFFSHHKLAACLLIAAALTLWPTAPAGAQSTCNGVPATIIGAAPGLINGTEGDDVILGTIGNDQIFGLGGDDVICAGRGDDIVDGGEGADTFVWNPGDANDTVEGRSGDDTLLFNGSNVGEHIDLSANGARVRFFRDVASVTMDLDGTEHVTFNALGGADTITVNSLAGTAVTSVTLNLAGTSGGNSGDGLADTVIVNGTASPDHVTLVGDTNGLAVSGLSAAVDINAAEGARDSLHVNLLEGDDTFATQPTQRKLFLSLIMAGGSVNNLARPAPPLTTQAQRNAITAEALPAGLIGLTLSGGPGNDTLNGSQGGDQIIGGPGNDQANLGAGDDTFIWNPGDGSDVIEGQAGNDTLQFNGANINEQIGISANGARLGLTRDVANIALSADSTEQVDLRALGGADTITVGNMSSTAVTTLTLDLAGTPGSGTGDAQIDLVAVNGTAGDDNITVSGSGSSAAVLGLTSSIAITGTESLDGLSIQSAGGNDAVNAQALPAASTRLTIDGGAGNDTIDGGQGADVLIGGDDNDQLAGNRGDDLAFLGAGDDTLIWNPGDGNDTVEGQAGVDTLVFNGSNAGEHIDLSANGARLRFFRDVANVTMDLNDTEHINFNALGGVDTVTVNNLAGTDAQQVNLNLASSLGSGDGQADTVIVNGTSAIDSVTISGSAGSLAVLGLGATVNVSAAEGTLDSLRVSALGGADLISAQTLSAGVVGLTLDGGSENDTLTGSAGDDVLTGGLGADHFSGGPGTDTVTDFNPGEGDTQDATIP
jgi:Ca2+-binding RTX toxin-like protein